MPKVNPQILIWARETAGLSEEEAAKKLGLSGVDRLLALETGDRDPSRRQLTKMAEKYRRPLLTFYLPERPRTSDKGQDFRTLPEGQAAGSEALLDALLRDVHARQGLVRAALEEAEEDVPLQFVGSARMEDGVNALVAEMNKVLGFSKKDFRAHKDLQNHPNEAHGFSGLRTAVERIGVFVLLMGNLGTHHTDIDPKVFRGFALSDDVAPFVIINEKDSRAAWSFTLLHELAHIWLGQTGISGYDGESDVEKFCDTVAARFLLDPAELVGIGAHEAASLDDLKERIGDFAIERNLSRKMVAYNLLRSNSINRGVYRRLSNAFDAERAAEKEGRPKGAGGPDYYIVKRHRVGPGLVSVVRRMVSAGALTTTKAARVLGVKPTAVSRLVGGSRAA